MKLDKDLAALLVLALNIITEDDTVDFESSIKLSDLLEKYELTDENTPLNLFGFTETVPLHDILYHIETATDRIQNCIEEYNALEREENSA